MDKEFLKDYTRELLDETNTFIENSINGNFSACEDYFKTRLNNPSVPISELTPHVLTSNTSIWSVVPTSKTIMITLAPYKNKEIFEQIHGFKIEEIQDIVDFTKNNKKIVFVLRTLPPAYEGMEFLEPIFSQLKPPLKLGYQPEVYFSEKEIMTYRVQFTELAKINLIPEMFRMSMERLGNTEIAEALITDMRENYVLLRALGYNQMADSFGDAICQYSQNYGQYYGTSRLLTKSLTYPLATQQIENTETIFEQTRFFEEQNLSLTKISNTKFSGDIGKLLLKKMVHAPPSLESCKQLSYIYEEESVYKVGLALSQAIEMKKPEIVDEKSQELEMILDNIWKDKTVSKRAFGVKVGIKVALAVIGAISNEVTGLSLGLLSSFGFDVLNEAFKFNDETISEKIGKAFSSNSEIVIYDFKKRYPNTKNC